MRVFISHSFEDTEQYKRLADALKTSGCEILSDFSVPAGDQWADVVVRALRSSDAVVALFNPGAPRANLLFELGVAVGAGKPVVLVSQPESSLPSDLNSLPCVSASDLNQLTRVLRQASARGAFLPPPLWLHWEKENARDFLNRCTRDDRLLDHLDGREFERLIADLLVERGWRLRGWAGRSGHRDDGYDFLLDGSDGGLIAVQVKRLPGQSRVSIESVHRLLAGATASGATEAWFVTTCPFTASAVEFARQATPPVRLLTLDSLLAFARDSGKPESNAGGQSDQ